MPLSRATLGAVLRAALVAGVLAALAAALFHLVASEPLIERAIALEEQMHGAAAAHEEPIVGRDVQRVGLFIGFLAYGLSLSLLFSVAFHAAQRWLPGRGPAARGALLALAAYAATALFPFAKYPANPPGVGDPETVGYRQALYLGAITLSIVGTAVALALARRGWPRGAAFLVLFAAGLYAALPANPDPVPVLPELLLPFRALSLGGLTLFWAVFGAAFAWIIRGAALEAAAPAAAVEGRRA